MNNTTNPKHRETKSKMDVLQTKNKISILLFISLILLFISVVGVNALIIGNRGDSQFKGVIDEVRIYNRALSEDEVIRHSQSSLYKYDIDKWSFYATPDNLGEDNYTYYGCAEDGAGNINCTETRLLVICDDADSDGRCDSQEPLDCVGENPTNIPDDTDCTTFNGFDYDNGCWDRTFQPVGTGCDLDQWHYNYSCSTDETRVINRYYNWSCSDIGICDVLLIGAIKTQEACSRTRECIGPNYSISPGDYDCACKSDIDSDGLCDGGDDQCERENSTNYDELGHNVDTVCLTWEDFDEETGCHGYATYEGTVVPENCPTATCYSPAQVNWTCNSLGAQYIPPPGKDCEKMTQECTGDPDYNSTTCADSLGKPEGEIICQKYEEKCYSSYTPYYPTWSGGGCCGDDTDECWIDGKSNACCYYRNLSKIVYLTDPDDSVDYCLLLGENKTGVSAGYCTNGESYCWDSNSEQCCGDDPDETWEYSTSYYIRDILVNETCYHGNWSVVKERKTTYYNLLSRILDLVG